MHAVLWCAANILTKSSNNKKGPSFAHASLDTESKL